MVNASKYDMLKYYEDNLMYTEDILGSGITNNTQLEKLTTHLFDNFIGVFAANEFPKYINNDSCFIINNKSEGKGEHWIAIFKRNKLYGYDSFDRNVHKLSKFWKNKYIVNANKDRQQSFKEYNCGSRCIAWLMCFHKFGSRIINVI